MDSEYAAYREHMDDAARTYRAYLEKASATEADAHPASTLWRISAATVNRLEVTARVLSPESVGEAAVLTRSLIEGAVSCAYIVAPTDAVERERRAKRFDAFEVVHRQLQADDYLRLVAEHLLPPAQQVAERNLLTRLRDAAIGRFAGLEKHFLGWTGKKWRDVKHDITVTHPGWPVNDLLESYVHFSAFVHATAWSVSISLDADDARGRELLALDVAFAGALAGGLTCSALSACTDGPGPDLEGLAQRRNALFRR
jgi:hypothetical protein